MSYKFIYSGSVAPINYSSDGRQASMLTAVERDFVLAEMRLFLSSVQAITEGVSNKDISQVMEAVGNVGAQAAQAGPRSLAGKLPITFKKLRRDTHKKFGMLVLDANQLG